MGLPLFGSETGEWAGRSRNVIIQCTGTRRPGRNRILERLYSFTVTTPGFVVHESCTLKQRGLLICESLIVFETPPARSRKLPRHLDDLGFFEEELHLFLKLQLLLTVVGYQPREGTRQTFCCETE